MAVSTVTGGSAVHATSISSSRTGRSTAGRDPGELGKDDFMKLMLAQLQHQDPLKPMDDQAFITQVAQFQTLDQMTAMNAAVSALLKTQQLSQASALIGRAITGLTDDGSIVRGTVTAATSSDGKPLVYVGSTAVRLEKVTSVAVDGSALSTIGATA